MKKVTKWVIGSTALVAVVAVGATAIHDNKTINSQAAAAIYTVLPNETYGSIATKLGINANDLTCANVSCGRSGVATAAQLATRPGSKRIILVPVTEATTTATTPPTTVVAPTTTAATTAVAPTTTVPASTTTTIPAPSTTSGRVAARWAPGPHEPWQWMIGHPLNTSSAADMKGGATDQPTVYDIDGFDNTAATVATLQSRGYHVICYIEVGSWVDYRPDSNQFPASIIGKGISGFSDKWTDIRSPLLRPIIENRIKMCASKGFDAVEPDLEDGYTNDTGFPLTAADQITFNTWVAATVHANGMSVLLKGDPEQAKQLAPTVDFFLNEQCNQYSECSQYPTLAASGGKTILNVEYSGGCPTSAFAVTNLNSTLFKVALSGPRTPCPNSTG